MARLTRLTSKHSPSGLESASASSGVCSRRTLGRHRSRSRNRVLDVVAVGASVAVPLVMSAWPEGDGALQRAMFAVAYAWYAVEAVRVLRTPPG